MKLLVPAVALIGILPACGADALIVCDEVPAMQVLARQLEQRVRVSSEITSQDRLPPSLSGYKAVIVYIHKDIAEGPEKAFIDYAKGGGKLVLLHHSISSGKRKNKDWLPFLGVELPTQPFDAGGYKYFDPASFEIVNRAPDSPITTRGVDYPTHQPDRFELHDTEIYLNHVLTGERTILLGLQYLEPKSGKLYSQDSMGWYKPTEKGEVYYFMAGHRAEDFENPAYAQIICNAVAAKPNMSLKM
jgi:hypothetical protein